MGFNSEGLLIHGFFSIVNNTVLHDHRLVEYMDAEPQIQRNQGYRGPAVNYMKMFVRSIGAPNPHVVQNVRTMEY